MNDSRLILKAAAFAGQAHSAQRRKASDEPYVNHLLRVAYAAGGAGLSSEAIAAALLHDVIEDTPVTAEELSAEFPARVVHLVQLLTQTWPDDAPRDEKERKRPGYLRGILSDHDAISIKLLDRADNLADMARWVSRIENWAARYLARSEVELKEIFKACQNECAKQAYLDALEDLRSALQETGRSH